MHNSRVMFSVNHKSFEGNAQIIDKNTDSKLAEEVDGATA
jgi:hypothetical protein